MRAALWLRFECGHQVHERSGGRNHAAERFTGVLRVFGQILVVLLSQFYCDDPSRSGSVESALDFERLRRALRCNNSSWDAPGSAASVHCCQMGALSCFLQECHRSPPADCPG